MSRLLVSAGGTGGGIYPALAVVEALVDEIEVLWIGGEGGMELSLVGRTGIPLKTIPAAGVHGVGLRRLPANVLQLGKGIFAARRVIKGYLPDVILFTGGYIGIPVALAGRGIPQVVFTPDIEPALALRVISRSADVIAVTAEESLVFYGDRDSVRVTGYPTRKGLQRIDKDRAREKMGLVSDKPAILFFGGSRGARSINFALWRRLSDYLQMAEVIHITGELDWNQTERAKKTLGEEQGKRYHAYPYLHEKMIDALGAADLIVSRAGASALGEYPMLGVPSVLIPYPHAWRYQKVNAEYLATHGASVILNDVEIDDRLLPAVKGLLSDQERLGRMASAARSLARPDAAKAIAGEVERLAKGGIGRD